MFLLDIYSVKFKKMPKLPKTNKISSNIRSKQYKTDYDDKRESAYKRGYDNAWRVIRIQHLQNHPLCFDCLKNGRYTPSEEVHHIIKLRDRPDLRDDPNNLMSLCKSCHSRRTADGQ